MRTPQHEPREHHDEAGDGQGRPSGAERLLCRRDLRAGAAARRPRLAGARPVPAGRPADRHQLALPRDGERVVCRFDHQPPSIETHRRSALAKKSRSTTNCPILECSLSISASPLARATSEAPAKVDAMPSIAWAPTGLAPGLGHKKSVSEIRRRFLFQFPLSGGSGAGR